MFNMGIPPYNIRLDNVTYLEVYKTSINVLWAAEVPAHYRWTQFIENLEWSSKWPAHRIKQIPVACRAVEDYSDLECRLQYLPRELLHEVRDILACTAIRCTAIR